MTTKFVIEGLRAVIDGQKEKIERLEEIILGHEIFRHQHRDCDSLSCENQGLRMRIKTAITELQGCPPGCSHQFHRDAIMSAIVILGRPMPPPQNEGSHK